jgi:tetratricopeptide (TPR) repeat protein
VIVVSKRKSKKKTFRKASQNQAITSKERDSLPCTIIGLKRLDLLVCLLLVATTLSVYWQVRKHEFVNLDDDLYVTENRYVQAGLTQEGVVWAFTDTSQADLWLPLTWLSLMLDSELYGLKAGGYKFTNVLFHLANTLLLFLVLKRMTGRLWPSAFVAGLFALHPLHVESVAWVTERKDVLSTLFWMLTMWAYLGYVERPGIKRYLVVISMFILGLMAKPMLVTLPFVLLLLDYWPLNRLHQAGNDLGGERCHRPPANLVKSNSLFSLVLEKSPLIFLAAVTSVATLLAQHRGGALESVDFLPIKARIANSLVAYVSYIGKMIWPRPLAVFYPHPGSGLPLWQAVGAGLLLACISVVLVRASRRYPYLMVGWFWYLGTLVPVIGLVQAGVQAMADRFTYVPLIGLFIITAWGIPDLLARWRHRRIVLSLAAIAILSMAMIFSWLQIQLWQNSLSLFEHTLSVTQNNWLVHNNLGLALMESGRLNEAVSHISEALRIKPDYAEAHNNLGVALGEGGNLNEAISHYSEALRIKPDYAEAHNNLGIALARQGRLQEAVNHFSEAVRVNPDFAKAHNNLGIALARQGRLQEAVNHFSEAVRLNPGYAEARNNLRQAARQLGKSPEVSNSLTSP